MSLARFSVNQSLFINLVSVIIIIIGLIAGLGINKEIFPNVSFDMVSVVTVYPGAAPADIEKLVTLPIEKELRQVDGIKKIDSTSAQGSSIIYLQIDPDTRNKQKVVQDIQSAVDRVKDLPEDTEDPEVVEVESKQYPIIEVSLSGEMSERSLQEHADTLEDILEDIDGIGKVSKSGYRERELQILVVPKRMQQYYVSMNEIESALAQRNINIPAGELNNPEHEYSIRTQAEFLTPEEVENVIIRANDAGNWLRIKDVAEVREGFKDEDIINKTQGTRSVNLLILKKESGDALAIVDEVKEKSSEYLSLQKDNLEISYVNDYSYYARRRLNVLQNNAWAAVIIVIGTLLIFLQKRIAFFAFLGIPVALFTTFIVMGAMGITINVVSMFGLIIVLGMLVDDGIIVAENVYRFLEQKTPPRIAAVKGTEQVMGAVVTAVITTIAAFSPLLFMTGIMGKFMRNLPTVVIIALLASLGEALIILPSHLADFVKVKLDAAGNPVAVAKRLPWFRKMVYFYIRFVKAAIRRKWLVFWTGVGITVAALSLIFLAFAAKGPLRFVLFPDAGIEFLFIRAEAPVGTPLEKTHQMMLPLEKLVAQLPREEMDTYVTTVGKIEEDRHDPFAGKGRHLGQITVYLTPEQSRKRTVDEITAALRRKAEGIKGFTDLRFDKPEAGPPVGKPVEARIRGEHFDTLDTISKEYMDYLETMEGATDITWDHKPGKEEIRVLINREKAATAGLTVKDIARTVRMVFAGGIATQIKPVKAEEETDVTVKFARENVQDLSVFDDIFVANKFGKLIALSKVADIEKVPGTTNIHHLDGKRVVTVSSNIDSDKTTSMEINKKLARKFRDISQRYIGYSVKYGGELEETIDSLKTLARAYLFAFLVIYLILASFFRSLVQPFVVMLAIPFGLIGVVVALLLHNMPLSFMVFLGIIGLSGIVVNDSIVLVAFINQLRAQGINRRASIIRAVQIRIRPVILTTVTTVGGLFTVAYGIGGKDPFLVPTALALSWGLMFATFLTLIIIPCIYSMIDDISLKITHRSSIIKTDKLKNNNNK